MPTREVSSITQLPTAQALEALDKIDDIIEMRRLAQECNVAVSPTTEIEPIREKIREVMNHFQERDGTPQLETRSKRVAPGTPPNAPELAVAGEPAVKLGEDQKVTSPNDLKGPDKQEPEDDKKTTGKTAKTEK